MSFSYCKFDDEVSGQAQVATKTPTVKQQARNPAGRLPRMTNVACARVWTSNLTHSNDVASCPHAESFVYIFIALYRRLTEAFLI
jgi:hypothetical protein